MQRLASMNAIVFSSKEVKARHLKRISFDEHFNSVTQTIIMRQSRIMTVLMLFNLILQMYELATRDAEHPQKEPAGV